MNMNLENKLILPEEIKEMLPLSDVLKQKINKKQNKTRLNRKEAFSLNRVFYFQKIFSHLFCLCILTNWI